MITGGVAAVIYGDPRFTRDIDVVLALDGASVPSLLGISTSSTGTLRSGPTST